MKYIVIEIQNNGGTVSTLTTTFDTLNEAKSSYHSILAAAAISSVDIHAATIIDELGIQRYSEYFDHRQQPELTE